MPSFKKQSKKKAKRAARLAPGKPKSARRLPALTAAKARGKSVGRLFEDFVAIQARLRAPGGCPWDREQTHATLKTYLIEESYEVLDALENGGPKELSEELGDLLLQILFHADIARETGSFDISDVIRGIHEKMVRRHPHVFGNVKAETSKEVLKNWAQLKAAEKQNSSKISTGEISKPISILEDVPRNLPALLEAYQLTRRAARIGFDWKDIEGIIEKMREEISELRVTLEESDVQSAEDEIGDILFVAVNLARFLKFDPEVALKKSNLKFKSRFQDMEIAASRSGMDLSKLSTEELEAMWEAAKSRTMKTLRPASVQ